MNRTRTFLVALFAAVILTAAAGAGFAVVHTAAADARSSAVHTAAGALFSAADPVTLKGYEAGIVDDTSTFVGLIPSGGVWKAEIVHGQLDKRPNHVTEITGGSFGVGTALSFDGSVVLTPVGPSLTVAGGEVVAGPSVGGRGFCTQAFEISGALELGGVPAGTFSGTLEHYGEKAKGSCEAEFASVTVTVPTAVFAP